MGFSFKKLVKKFDSTITKMDPVMAETDVGLIQRNKKTESEKAVALQREKAAVEAANTAAENLRRNLGIDLQTNNVANVEAGGSAMLLDELAGTKKRKGGSSPALSSTLGIRV